MENVFADLTEAFGGDEWWSAWISKKDESKLSILDPLADVTSCTAAIYGSASSHVRQGIIAEADKSIQSVLRSKFPDKGFYFGDPTDAIQSQMQYAFMSSAVNSKASTSGAKPDYSRKGSFAPAPKKKPYTPSSPSSDSKTSGNAHGRASRGWRGGRKQ